jgi:major type 1 subunit fimbrin (pilin)
MARQIKKTTVAAHLLGAVAALTALQVHATDGTITFTGSIQATTCTVDTTSSELTVPLPAVQPSAFKNAGDTAGTSLIKINLSNCTGEGTVLAGFESGATVDTTTGRLKNTATTGATGVQIQLLNKDFSAISIGDSATYKGEALSGSTTTLSYYAQYYATSNAVTAGNVQSSVTYSLAYE